jgi:hypothetical protein
MVVDTDIGAILREIEAILSDFMNVFEFFTQL